MIQELIAAAAAEEEARDEVPLDELASYCVNALAGAAGQRSNGAVRRLVSLTMDGLRSPRGRTIGDEIP